MKDAFSNDAAGMKEAFSDGGTAGAGDALPGGTGTPPKEALPGAVPRPFVLLDAVSGADAHGLTAWRRFDAAPFWQGMEAAAQAAALHQRFLSGFSRHAFLLSVDECPLPGGCLCGMAEIRATLLGGSLSALAYRVDLIMHGTALPGGGGAAGFPPAAARAGMAPLAPQEGNPPSRPCPVPEGGRVAAPPERRDGLAPLSGAAGLLEACPAGLPDCAGTDARPRTAGPEAASAWTFFLSIGLAPYDATFQRDALESRYRGLFQWLTRNAPSAAVSTAG